MVITQIPSNCVPAAGLDKTLMNCAQVCAIMLCSKALNCFDHASENCSLYAHVMLTYDTIHEHVMAYEISSVLV